MHQVLKEKRRLSSTGNSQEESLPIITVRSDEDGFVAEAVTVVGANIYRFVTSDQAKSVDRALRDLLQVTMLLLEKERANALTHLLGSEWIKIGLGSYYARRR